MKTRKKTKNAFVPLLLAIILMSLYGVSAHDYRPTHYYTFDTDGEDTGYAATLFNLEGTNDGFVPAIVDDGVDFEEASSQSMSNISANPGDESTVEFWAKIESGGQFIRAVDWGDATLSESLNIYSTNNNKWAVQKRSGGSTIYTTETNIDADLGDWQYIVLVANSSGTYLWKNASEVEMVSSETDFWDLQPDDICVGKRCDGASYFDGVIDNVAWWNESYSHADIVYGYNGGDGRDYAASPDPSGVDINLISPGNGTLTNNATSNFEYNVTSLDGPLSTTQLYLNVSGVWQAVATNTTPSNASTNNYIYTLSEGTYLWNVRANISNGSEYFASENFTLEVDLTEPEFSTDNSPVWNGQYAVLTGKTNTPNLLGNINVTDPNGNLWSFNASIPGQRVIYNITQIGNSTISYSLNHNASDLAPGNYNLSIYAADGHTAKKIPRYKYARNPLGNSIKYQFQKGNKASKDFVEVNVAGTSGSVTTQKRKDRYTWTYERGMFSPRGRLVQHLTSSHEIVPVTNSEYNAHFVIPHLEKWIDFELENPTGNENYQVERISPTHYKITITNIDLDRPVTFQSIGDLNTNQQYYSFNVINVTTTHQDPAISTTQTPLVLNFTNANQSYDVTASLTYDSTEYASPTKTQTADHISFEQVITHQENESTNNTYQWNFTLTGPNGQQFTNTTTPETQEVLSYDLVQCSAGQQPIANFSLFNEASGQPVTGSIEASFETAIVSDQASGTTKEFGFELSGSSSYALCRTPETINLNVSTQAFTYTNSESTIRNYELLNNLWSNTTRYYDLYLINESLSTDVILEVRDTNDEEVSDALITVKRLYPANNTFVPVEVARTDFTGKTQVDIILDDVFYAFTIELDGVVVKEIPASRIFSTSLLFVIDTLDQLPSVTDKVFWDIQPASPILPEPINFSFQAAPVNDFVVEWFAIQSHYNNTAYVTNSTNAAGGTVLVSVPINDTGLIPNRYFIKMQSESDVFVFNRTYVVTEAPGNNSITSFTDDLNTIFPPWVRAIIAVILSLIAALAVGAFVGAEGAALTAVLVQLFFALPVIGWIPFFMFIVQIIIIAGLYLVFGREVA